MDCYLRCFVLLGLAIYCCEAQRRNSCTTPDNKGGSCISLNQCPPLLQLLGTVRTNPNAGVFVQKSRCGFEDDNRTAKVCCPSNGSSGGSSGSGSGGGSGGGSGSIRRGTGINPPNCGVPFNEYGDKIVGGRPAERGNHPWLAALGYRNSRNPTVKWKCGGALVNQRYVITAAHCLQHPTLNLYLARLGEHNLDNRVQDGANPIDIEIAKAIGHPSYDSNTKFNDIALLLLKRPVTYDAYIKPICLPLSPEQRSNNFLSKSPTVAGWGRLEYKGVETNILMEVSVPVVSNQKCKTMYATKGGTIIDKQLCAGEAGMDACQGDSGGPLIAPLSANKYYLIGVVSYGFQCAVKDFPGIYTRVTSYLDWIQDTVI